MPAAKRSTTAHFSVCFRTFQPFWESWLSAISFGKKKLILRRQNSAESNNPHEQAEPQNFCRFPVPDWNNCVVPAPHACSQSRQPWRESGECSALRRKEQRRRHH